MKRVIYFMAMAAGMCATACYQGPVTDEVTDGTTEDGTRGTRPVTFRLQGDWSGTTEYEYARTRVDDGVTRAGGEDVTRATALAASDMTALWIYDYDADGELLASQMWEKGGDGWSAPTMQMQMGEHRIVAVASRGTGANETAEGISWEKPSDTFAADISLDVNVGMDGSVALPLTRWASRLSVVMTDAVPDGVKYVSITMSDRVMGLNIPALTGTTATESTVQVDISSAVGKANQRINVFTLTPDDKAFTTDVEVAALDADGVLICSVNIADVELLRGRTTVLTGQVFSQQPGFTVTLDDAWVADKTVTF